MDFNMFGEGVADAGGTGAGTGSDTVNLEAGIPAGAEGAAETDTGAVLAGAEATHNFIAHTSKAILACAE